MYIKTKLLLFILVHFAVSAQAVQCIDLFSNQDSQTIEAAESVTITHNEASADPAKLVLTQKHVLKDSAKAAIEITRQALLSSNISLSDKNFVKKDHMTLGYKLGKDYFLEVVYKSDSRVENKFVIKEISIVSPTGYKTLVTKDIFHEDRYELQRSEFEITKYFEPGTVIDVAIPFIIEGKTLDILEKYADAFELFTKTELRQLFSLKSEKVIAQKILLRKAKDIFYKVLVKEPFKILLGVVVMFSIMTMQNDAEPQPLPIPAPQIQQYMQKDNVEFEHVQTLQNGKTVKYKIIGKEVPGTDRIDFLIQPVQ